MEQAKEKMRSGWEKKQKEKENVKKSWKRRLEKRTTSPKTRWGKSETYSKLELEWVNSRIISQKTKDSWGQWLCRWEVVFLGDRSSSSRGGCLSHWSQSLSLSVILTFWHLSDIFLSSFWHISVIFISIFYRIFVIILSFCLSVFLSLCLFVFLSFCLSVIISFYLSFCLSSSKFIVHC